MSGAPTQRDVAAAAPVPEFLCAGSSFARYQIVRCIGVGGMGAVFEATHSLLRKRVALKAMHSALGRSEGSRARFLREAETVARIRHPNVVDISDVGIERGVPYLVMEFLEGEDLAAVLVREGRLSVARAVAIVLPVVAGLCAVHRLGIVHRDIKPENVFLALDPLGGVVPKLLDFGVSKDLEASGHAGAAPGHTVAGTPFYMAPEQAHGSAVLDARADQYALGVLLYQCLAGVRPFQSESLLELIHLIDSGSYQPLGIHRDDLPAPLVALIARAMARDPEQRFASTEAFGQALAAFADDALSKACARDFATERRLSLGSPAESRASTSGSPAEPGASTFGSPAEPRASTLSLRPPAAEQAPRSAPTFVNQPPLGPTPDAPVAPTVALPRRSISGVQARDSAAAPLGPARVRRLRPRTAFVLAALVTLLCLVGVLAALLARRLPEPAAAPARGDRPAARGPAAGGQQAPGAADPSAAPSDAPEPAPQPRHPSGKPRRPGAPNSAPARPDIQLSR